MARLAKRLPSLALIAVVASWALIPGVSTSPACRLCVNFVIIPPILDFPPYRLFDYTCILLQQLIAIPMEKQIANQNLTLITPFSVDASACSELTTQTCATFASEDDALLIEPILDQQMKITMDFLSETLCPVTSGYSVQSYTGTDDCVYLQAGSACKREANIFPSCRCKKEVGITPLYVVPEIQRIPGRTLYTSLHCFRLGIIPEQYRVQSTCSNKGLSKVEIWADEKMRSKVRGLRVTPNGSNSTFIAASWGPSGDNTLKATPLNWTMDQAAEGEICIELRNDVALHDFCLGNGNGCYLSLVNDDRECCPIYGTGSAFAV